MRPLLVAALCIEGWAIAPTVEIAKDVLMPMINHGNGNQTLWVELGGRGLDTALEYSPASGERIKMAVEASIVDRSELFITTKIPCCPSDFFQSVFCKDFKDWHSTGSNIDLALNRIGIDQVDLLLMHYPCRDWEGTVAAYKEMEAAMEKGKVRAIGVSNFNASMLEALTKHSKIKPAVTQNAYSIGNHFDPHIGADDATLRYCHKHGITLSAWSPLGGVNGRSSSIFKSAVVKSIANAKGKSPAQIALRWDIQQGIVPVTSGENAEHVLQNLDVFDFQLTADEMQRLAAVGRETGQDTAEVLLYM